MFSFAAKGVDLLKKRAVFSLLIFCPDDDSYIVSSFRILSHSSKLALQNNKLSYAKKQIISFGPHLQGEKPIIPPSTIAFLKSSCNPSVHNRKRKGDRRSPRFPYYQKQVKNNTTGGSAICITL